MICVSSIDNRLSVEKSDPGRRGLHIKNPLREKACLKPELRRKDRPKLPEMSEFDVIRHYTRLSRLNFSVDTHFYPLGSCTMKYNPRFNEEAAALEGFANLHPLAHDNCAQGTLELLHDLGSRLNELLGLDALTLQPAAGAHSEFTGLLVAKAYFESRREERNEIIVPDSAHGTNPASASRCGFHPVTVRSNARGELT
ncbi:MAG: aminomethyl-transferring glycine dehydrogenase subunit GcvPB, partial [Elusimicrobiales bacterium]|nr:aminomethyl-transferring glycine dehydrogenase subunit GcvPB [Elusimicrobiales bacterium]